MTPVHSGAGEPAPGRHAPGGPPERELREHVDGEVRFHAGSRAAYSTDASNFRQVPIGVVVPRTPEAAVAAVDVCRGYDLPVLSRGGGTSLAGQCTNAAVVLDWTKYCHRVTSVDLRQRTCVVEPGIVLDVLNRQLADTGLRFGPEPATHLTEHGFDVAGLLVGSESESAAAPRPAAPSATARLAASSALGGALAGMAAAAAWAARRYRARDVAVPR